MYPAYSRIALLLLLPLLFLQCDPEDDSLQPTTENCLIATLVDTPSVVYSDSTDYLPVNTYTHIIEDDLITERLRNGQPYEKFIRDAAGLLTSVQTFRQGSWYTSDVFQYEGQHVVKATAYGPDGSILRDQDLVWEGDQLRSGYALSALYVNGNIEWYENSFRFTYENGNIVMAEETFYQEDGDSLVTRDRYTYDTQENYLPQLNFTPLHLIQDFNLWYAPYWFSANNVLLETSYNVVDAWTGEKAYTYTWEDGRVAAFEYTAHTHISTDPFVRQVDLTYTCW